MSSMVIICRLILGCGKNPETVRSRPPQDGVHRHDCGLVLSRP